MAFRKPLVQLLLFCAAIFLSQSLQAQSNSDVHFASDPAVSPDGETVVFVYENDLWQVPADGGRAVRLTGMDGEESNPSISPDGNWLAFTSNQYGNNDVYRMPLNGGKIEQLTYHQASDQVESWSWDSETIYFRSGRYNRTSTYSVSASGGTPERLFGHYHNTVHNLVKHPDEDEYFFNESWESFTFPQRKKYRGPFNPDIKSYNTESEEFTKHTDWEGKDFWPMVDRNGSLYFVSDEANGEYNLYTLKNGSKQQLTDFDTSVRYPSISADGSTIVYEKEYQLYRYDIGSDNSQQIPISIYKNNTLTKHQSFNTYNNITAFDVSPDKKKLAFVSRGELFVSDMEGKFVRQIETSDMGRVLEVKWLSENKRLIFNQTVDGYQNWFTAAADGSGTPQQLTDEQQNSRMLAFNSDRSQAVYLSGRNELMLMDMESLESEVIVEDEFWGFYNEQPRFAPDDEHILYTAKRDFEDDIFSYNLETEESINLTKTGVSETGAYWSPDGKYVYFASSRTRPSYPRGGGNTDLFRMALTTVEEPYRSTKFEKLFEEEEKKEDEKTEKEETTQEDTEKPEVTINEEGLMQRLEQIGANFGSQGNPFVLQDDDKTTVLYSSNHDEGETSLWKTTLSPFEDSETAKFDGVENVSDLINVDGDVYGLSDGSIHKIDVGAGKASQIEIRHSFERNLRAEFNQMFEELWANIEENFYNETFHGINWTEIRDRYRTYLPYVNSRDDFSRMMNDMLGELNSSHMGFSTFGPESQEYYETVTLATGIRFSEENPYQVEKLVKDSPADIADENIQSGDRLVAVNGKQVNPDRNRESYFTSPEMKEEMTLRFARDNSSYTVKIHPTSYFSVRTDLYDEWIQEKQETVDQETDKRVAYVHMKNMGGGELEDFYVEMTSEAYKRDAIILDLRYNTGGNVHDDVLQFLTQRPYLQWKYRNGDYASQPNFTPNAKPIVLLVNEQSLSDAEVTAAGFKELGLGPVIGTETYRWIIFTSGKGLVDGSFYRLPSWGVYTLEGKNLERTGVNPDIPVDNTFKHRLEGQDPQLQRAIQEVMDQLNSN
jgi:tricorn protease